MPLQSRVPFGAIFDPPWIQQNFSRLRIMLTTLHAIPCYSIALFTVPAVIAAKKSVSSMQ